MKEVFNKNFKIELNKSFLKRILSFNVSFISIMGVFAEIDTYFIHHKRTIFGKYFSLIREYNVPNWYISTTIYFNAFLLLFIYLVKKRLKDPFKNYWLALSLMFFYISLDEAVQIHEYLSELTPLNWGGFFYYDWVVPFGILTVFTGILFIKFINQFNFKDKKLIVLSGSLYVFGALIMDMVLGYYHHNFGNKNFTYSMIDTFEESLENIGMNIFLFFLITYLFRLLENYNIQLNINNHPD